MSLFKLVFFVFFFYKLFRNFNNTALAHISTGYKPVKLVFLGKLTKLVFNIDETGVFKLFFRNLQQVEITLSPDKNNL